MTYAGLDLLELEYNDRRVLAETLRLCFRDGKLFAVWEERQVSC